MRQQQLFCRGRRGVAHPLLLPLALLIHELLQPYLAVLRDRRDASLFSQQSIAHISERHAAPSARNTAVIPRQKAGSEHSGQRLDKQSRQPQAPAAAISRVPRTLRRNKNGFATEAENADGGQLEAQRVEQRGVSEI